MWRTCKERDRQKPAFLIIWFLLFLLFFFPFCFHAFAERNSFLCFDLINISFPHFILFVLAFYVSKFELKKAEFIILRAIGQVFHSEIVCLRTSLTFIYRNGKIFFTHLLIPTETFFFFFQSRYPSSSFFEDSVRSRSCSHCMSRAYLIACRRDGGKSVRDAFMFSTGGWFSQLWIGIRGTCSRLSPHMCSFFFSQTWTDAWSLYV